MLSQSLVCFHRLACVTLVCMDVDRAGPSSLSRRRPSQASLVARAEGKMRQSKPCAFMVTHGGDRGRQGSVADSTCWPPVCARRAVSETRDSDVGSNDLDRLASQSYTLLSQRASRLLQSKVKAGGSRDLDVSGNPDPTFRTQPTPLLEIQLVWALVGARRGVIACWMGVT
jgi:hypothetical protein